MTRVIHQRDIERRSVRLRAREFAQDVLLAGAAEARDLPDPAARFQATRPTYEEMVKAGFLKDLIPAKHGGTGLSATESFAMVEELSAVDPGVTLTLLATTLGLAPLMSSGNQDQLRRHLPVFLSGSGSPLAAFAFSEPEGSANFENAESSDTGMQSTAAPDGTGWRIDGSKNWISNAYGWEGEGPDLMTVTVATNSREATRGGSGAASDGERSASSATKELTVFCVEKGSNGLNFGEPINTTGLRTHLLPRVYFHGLLVNDRARVGAVGEGAQIVGAAFGGGAGVGALALGIGDAALSFALGYTGTKSRGGGIPIVGHQSVSFALVDAKIRLEAVRSLLYRAANAIDARADDAFELSVAAKIFASETVVDVISKLMLVVGVESYSDQTPLTFYLNEALALPLIGGSNNGFRRRQLSQCLRNA
ncbi:acyl-CoA dehydrogenase family protein [Arthrobacter sp. Cr_A7]|uniref:acyl-CoA dehydrogenase family protein n=1 Tax=Arthrobacter sp. Cr_A7 TaxID=3031017 RepID=UPI0023DA18AB|nr:acyl-CoA dehydrogenase family protein [Arthrobacter sp. Cr_A7]MDF2052236.1 acyl-CoA/acyl-ACP dehydrogenase [Arthrobacter sp. Cr_A7]